MMRAWFNQPNSPPGSRDCRRPGEALPRRDRNPHRLSLLHGNANRRDPYQEELVQIEEELQKDGRRLREYVDELRDLGIEPANGTEGLVDFPALVDGRKVFLCWKLGEPEVRFWHEPNAGYRQRHPLQGQNANPA